MQTHFGLLVGTPNEHVQQASLELVSDEALAELLSTAEAFGSARIYFEPYFDALTIEPTFEDMPDYADYWLVAVRTDEGYDVQEMKRYGYHAYMVRHWSISFEQANKL